MLNRGGDISKFGIEDLRQIACRQFESSPRLPPET